MSSAIGDVDLSNKTWKLDAGSGDVTSIDVGALSKSVLRYVQNGRIEFDGEPADLRAGREKRIEKSQLLAKIDRLAIQPPKFPQPIEAITGQLQLTGDRRRCKTSPRCTAAIASHSTRRSSALGDLPQRIELLNILGNIEFVAPAANYPAPLAKFMQHLNPTGKLDVQGVAALIGATSGSSSITCCNCCRRTQASRCSSKKFR